MIWIICIVAAWVAGSIPFGVLLGKLRGVDIREHGSRNIGATNVRRVLGWRLGVLCFVLDGLKGAVPTIAAGVVNGTWGRDVTGPDAIPVLAQLGWLAIPVAAVLGHMFSPFIGFRGGKGVATGFGGLLAIWPVMTGVCIAGLVVWFVTLRLTRYVSAASMVGSVFLPFGFLSWHSMRGSTGVATVLEQAWPPLVVTALIAALVVVRHRANLGRIFRGEEPRIGASAPDRSAHDDGDPDDLVG